MSTTNPDSNDKNKESRLEEFEEYVKHTLNLTDEEFEEITKSIINLFYRSRVLSNHIDPRGKDTVEIVEELKALVEQHNAANVKYTWITDYTSYLLKEARAYKKDKRFEMACLMYATWLEHWLNDIVGILSERKGLDEKEIIQLIRQTNFASKSSWLLKLLDLPIFDPEQKTMMEIMVEFRNGFVHYKWQPENRDREETLKDLVLQFENTVKYLQNYENAHIYYGKGALM